MAEGDEDLPRCAKIVKTLLRLMAVDDYEPRVIHQLWYRYVVDVLTDAQVYSEHAVKAVIDRDDVKLAIQSKVNFSFSQPPLRELTGPIGVGQEQEQNPIAESMAGPEIPLPPEQDTLISSNYQFAIPKKQTSQAVEETKEDEEIADPNPNPRINDRFDSKYSSESVLSPWS